MISKNSSVALLDIFLSPRAAFNGLLNAEGWSWLPFAFISIMLPLSYWTFFTGMSHSWLIEQQMFFASDMSPAEMKIFKDNISKTVRYMWVLNAVSSWLFIIMMAAATGGYFLVVGKVLGNSDRKLNYSNWFGFAIWSQMPLVLKFVGLFAIVFVSVDPNLPVAALNFASLNQLLSLALLPSDDGYILAELIDLFMVWGIFLSSIGLAAWCTIKIDSLILKIVHNKNRQSDIKNKIKTNNCRYFF